MCGIVGIIGSREVSSYLLDSLERLEYRGYDSAGIATICNNSIARRRSEGKLKKLRSLIESQPIFGTTGIGHTRWATHGLPNENNAHPHATDKVAVVHNGIIENYAQIKSDLEKKGYEFQTETDTEAVCQLTDYYLSKGMSPEKAADKAFDKLEGAYAIVMIFANDENIMIGARQGTPLAIGYGEDEMFLASDSYALAPLTKKVCFLEDGDRVVVSANSADIYRIEKGKRKPIERPIRITAQSGLTAGKGEYPHFMLKEIYEQPSVISETLNSLVNPATGEISLPSDLCDILLNSERITLSACGTAYYACMIGKYLIESIAGTFCDLDIASELRYRNTPLPEKGSAIFVSQSGETLDALEALRHCKRNGQKIVSIVNTIESTIERESDICIHTLAGPEIGVASTKAFTTQITSLTCIALALAQAKEKAGIKPNINPQITKKIAQELRRVPALVADVLGHDGLIKDIAKEMSRARDVLYLGRGIMYPLAMEGALKLKEISYIHAEGYAAGEMKHGPISLIDENVPIVIAAPSNDPLFEKTASNLQETYARGGRILLISDQKGVKRLEKYVAWHIEVDEVYHLISPVLYALPAQLLAYHIAVAKGTDVDQPRNLAKSVTVE